MEEPKKPEILPEDQIIIHDGLGVSESRSIMIKPPKPKEPEILPTDSYAEGIRKKAIYNIAMRNWERIRRGEPIKPYNPIPRPSDYTNVDDYNNAKKDFVEKIHQVNLKEPVSKLPEEVVNNNVVETKNMENSMKISLRKINWFKIVISLFLAGVLYLGWEYVQVQKEIALNGRYQMSTDYSIDTRTGIVYNIQSITK